MTLGRQALLQPVDWGRDGWFRARAAALAGPLRVRQGGQASCAMPPLADDFRAHRLGLQWRFYDAAPDETSRTGYDGQGLLLTAKGTGPADCSPLTCVAGDISYQAELAFELLDGAVRLRHFGYRSLG